MVGLRWKKPRRLVTLLDQKEALAGPYAGLDKLKWVLNI
jgi:hypothetical protein